MLTFEQLADIKTRNPVPTVAGQWVRLRRNPSRHGAMIGSCPVCSPPGGTADGTRFECDQESWVCAVCQEAGDVIKLVMKREGCAFREAVSRLGGPGEATISLGTARAAGTDAFRNGAPCTPVAPYDANELSSAFVDGWRAEETKATHAATCRKRERQRLWTLWLQATRLGGTAVDDYLAGRGLPLAVPAGAQLRCHRSMPMFANTREGGPTLLHRGPAMLAKISGEGGAFIGLHITWLDPRRVKGRPSIVDPMTGQPLPTKKCRGSKAGGYIDLGFAAVRPGPRMFVGEGIESVLAAYTALARTGRLRPGDQFRCSIDLGNLAGKAVGMLAHPEATSRKGQALRVPGPEPDLTSPAMPVPGAIDELVILGDGDSDPFMTRNAVERARRRHQREGRNVRCVFPPERPLGA